MGSLETVQNILRPVGGAIGIIEPQLGGIVNLISIGALPEHGKVELPELYICINAENKVRKGIPDDGFVIFINHRILIYIHKLIITGFCIRLCIFPVSLASIMYGWFVTFLSPWRAIFLFKKPLNLIAIKRTGVLPAGSQRWDQAAFIDADICVTIDINDPVMKAGQMQGKIPVSIKCPVIFKADRLSIPLLTISATGSGPSHKKSAQIIAPDNPRDWHNRTFPPYANDS